MKSLLLAVMLIASMLFANVAIAAPKHAPAKHGQAPDASQTVDQPDAQAPPPEPVDTSWKGRLGALVVGMGGATMASVLHVHPAYIAVAILAVAALLLLWILFVIVRAVLRLLAQRGDRVYASDYVNSIQGRQEPRAALVKPNVKAVTARAAQQIARSQAAAKDHADFDVSKFLRSANGYFLRLQVAWDRGDLTDLKQFVTREIYDELKSQIRARESVENQTSVDTLDAELLKLETGDGKYVATVKFSGIVREEESAQTKFMEVWSLTRRIESKNWRLAGIQQFA